MSFVLPWSQTKACPQMAKTIALEISFWFWVFVHLQAKKSEYESEQFARFAFIVNER